MNILISHYWQVRGSSNTACSYQHHHCSVTSLPQEETGSCLIRPQLLIKESYSLTTCTPVLLCLGPCSDSPHSCFPFHSHLSFCSCSFWASFCNFCSCPLTASSSHLLFSSSSSRFSFRCRSFSFCTRVSSCSEFRDCSWCSSCKGREGVK